MQTHIDAISHNHPETSECSDCIPGIAFVLLSFPPFERTTKLKKKEFLPRSAESFIEFIFHVHLTIDLFILSIFKEQILSSFFFPLVLLCPLRTPPSAEPCASAITSSRTDGTLYMRINQDSPIFYFRLKVNHTLWSSPQLSVTGSPGLWIVVSFVKTTPDWIEPFGLEFDSHSSIRRSRGALWMGWSWYFRLESEILTQKDHDGCGRRRSL